MSRYSLQRLKSRLNLYFYHHSEDRRVLIFQWTDRWELCEERRPIEIDRRDEARTLCEELGYDPFDEKRLRLIISALYYTCWKVGLGESEIVDNLSPRINHGDANA